MTAEKDKPDGWPAVSICYTCTNAGGTQTYDNWSIEQVKDCSSHIQHSYAGQPAAIAEKVMEFNSAATHLSEPITNYFTVLAESDCGTPTCTIQEPGCSTLYTGDKVSISGANIEFKQDEVAGYGLTSALQICVKCVSSS